MRSQGNITVDGTLVVAHQGSVVQVSDDAVVTNNGTINVNLTTPTLGSRDFMVLGSPMTADTRTGVWNSAFLVLNHNTANFVPNPAVAAAFPGAENFADDNYDNWTAYSGGINPAEGYIVRPQSGYGQPGGIFNYTYDQGTLNNGAQPFAVIYNTPGPTPADNKNASPNILANPYASAIWANDFINANAMVDEVYFWEHNTPPSPNLPGAGSMNFSMEDISMYNLAGGTPAASGGSAPNGYIATGQGFGIKASAAGTAVFNNAMRRVDNNNTLRDAGQTVMDRLWIEVSTPEFGMQHTTLIAFSDHTTAGLDKGYDSRRLATVLSLYTFPEDGQTELGIQSREAFQTGMKVPMGFSTLIADEVAYEISIANIEGEHLANATVYLVDNELGNIVSLNDGSYTFAAKDGTYDGRFTIVFEGEQVLGSPSNGLEALSLYPNPTKGLVTVFSPKAPIEQVKVYDVQGRVVATTAEKGFSVRLDLNHLKGAIYLVEITTQEGTLTKRLIKE
ncbi:MAG: T9SS type A sorting domain-containing protein [Flavobacteriaceae bacterium]